MMTYFGVSYFHLKFIRWPNESRMIGIATKGVFLLLFIIIKESQAQSYECPLPWIEFGGYCYKFERLTKTLEEARTDCAEDGAQLLTISSNDEHNFVVRTVKLYEAPSEFAWYTSGHQVAGGSLLFEWENEDAQHRNIEGLQYWLSGEPNVGENRVRIAYTYKGNGWGWVLVDPTVKRGYICEISREYVFKIRSEERGIDYGVAEIDPLLLKTGPTITQQPQDFIYDSGSTKNTLSLQCLASSNPKPEYQWTIEREGQSLFIDPVADDRFTIINGELIITDPQDTVDNGDYQCRATNEIGTVLSDFAEISFGYLLDFPKSKRDPVAVDAYSGIGIECNPPKHYPAIHYSWFKDSIRNFIYSKYKPYIFISNTGKLLFSMATKDDAGDYFCQVSSPRSQITSSQGGVSQAIRLVVRETSGNVNEPQIATGFPVAFPSSPLRNQLVRIECFAFGTTITEVSLDYSWRRLDGAMPSRAIFSDFNRVLEIPDLELADAGEYECTASREHGQSDSATLQLPVESPPYFILPLQDQHVDRGSTLEWRCLASGKPDVTYEWYRNGEPIIIEDMLPIDANRYSIDQNVLTIKEVNEDDNAMYQCAAANLHGIRFSSGQLRVLYFAPTFRKYPIQKTTYGARGGNVTIICKPEAAPTATMEWKKDGSTFTPTTRVQIFPNGNLFFTQLRDSDSGEYTCIATNELGTDESTGSLAVLTPVTVTQYPKNTVVVVNGTAFLACEASYNPLLDVTYEWYHNEYHIEFQKVQRIGDRYVIIREEHYSRGEGIKRGGLFITAAQFENAGEYRCIIDSGGIKIEQKAIVTVVGPPGRPAGVDGGSVTNTSVHLTWVDGENNHREITSYTVEGYNMLEGFWKEVKSNIPRVGSTEYDLQGTTVEGLSPWSKYVFRVRAANEYGLGEPSRESIEFTTFEAAPLVAPRNVGGGGGKVGVLTITWEPLTEAEQNGENMYYTVYWKKKYLVDEEFTSVNVSGRETTQYTALVGSVNFYSQYDVVVQAGNRMGRGPKSPMVTIWSSEDIPIGVPTNVRARRYNATALRVIWEPVPDTIEFIKGVLLGYRINFWKEMGEDETMAIYRPLAGQRNEGLIIGLEPKTFYYVNVQVFNSAGNGPKSQDFLEETLRKAPQNQPTEVKVRAVGSYSVEVKWRGVSTDYTEEPLVGYLVKYWRNGESYDVASKIDANKKTSLIIDNLEPDTRYNLRVLGYSRGGEGLASSPINQFSLGCYGSSGSVDVHFVYTCNSCIHKISSTLLVLAVLLQLSLLTV